MQSILGFILLHCLHKAVKVWFVQFIPGNLLHKISLVVISLSVSEINCMQKFIHQEWKQKKKKIMQFA